MNHWLAALERMAAYEARCKKNGVSIKLSHGSHASFSRGIEMEADNSGVEQFLDRGLTNLGEAVWARAWFIR